MSEAPDLVQCINCFSKKPSVDFITKKGKRSPSCTICRTEWAQKQKTGQFRNPKRKRCTICNLMKPNREFAQEATICWNCTHPEPSSSSPKESSAWNSYRTGFRRW